MKKILLSALAISASLLTFGQDVLSIYGPTAPADFFVNGAYSFDGISFDIDTAATGELGPVSLTGSSAGPEAYYVGGFGLAQFTGPGTKAAISTSNYAGTVENTTVILELEAIEAPAEIKLQFIGASATYGAVLNVATPTTEVTSYTVNASDLKEIIANNPTGDAITDAEMLTLDEFQVVFSCSANMGDCSVDALLHSLSFSSVVSSVNGATEVQEILSFPNPAVEVVNFSKELTNVSVLNSMGEVILTADKASSLEVSELTSGVYFVRSEKFNSTFVVK